MLMPWRISPLYRVYMGSTRTEGGGQPEQVFESFAGEFVLQQIGIFLTTYFQISEQIA